MGANDSTSQKRMARKKRKKKEEKGIKWFPGHDLYVAVAIVIVVGAVMICKACNV